MIKVKNSKETRPTIQELLYQAPDLLKSIAPQEAVARLRVLLCFILNINRTELFTRLTDRLTIKESELFLSSIKRLQNHEPIQYITGQQEFYGRTFLVNKNVLIPRPETEELVALFRTTYPQNVHATVVDLGTGSGAIAITLALECPNLKLIAVDKSLTALKQAKVNAKRHQVQERITFYQGNFLAPVNEQADVILSNPPYISTEELATLPKHVRNFEPKLALAGGRSGLAAYHTILDQITKLSYKPNLVLLEIGMTQGEQVTAIITAALPMYSCKVKKDLSGKERFIMLEKNTS
ncbi:MAG: peptide chain release factor N(5)-glutamine methyltransferase [Bacillota bacterium]|jgi:release factor glutamine methyltransferase